MHRASLDCRACVGTEAAATRQMLLQRSNNALHITQAIVLVLTMCACIP